MSTRYYLPWLLVGFGVAAGCGGERYGVSAVNVEVYDARTGAPAAYHATLIVQDGTYADTVRGWEVFAGADPERQYFLAAADNRPGAYDVTVVHPDYEVWRRDGVRVRSDGGISPFDGSSLPEGVVLRADLIPR